MSREPPYTLRAVLPCITLADVYAGCLQEYSEQDAGTECGRCATLSWGAYGISEGVLEAAMGVLDSPGVRVLTSISPPEGLRLWEKG